MPFGKFDLEDLGDTIRYKSISDKMLDNQIKEEKYREIVRQRCNRCPYLIILATPGPGIENCSFHPIACIPEKS
jgi:hypothetical protein